MCNRQLKTANSAVLDVNDVPIMTLLYYFVR